MPFSALGGVPMSAQRWASTRVRGGSDGLASPPRVGRVQEPPSLSDVAGRDGTLPWTALCLAWARGAQAPREHGREPPESITRSRLPMGMQDWVRSSLFFV